MRLFALRAVTVMGIAAAVSACLPTGGGGLFGSRLTPVMEGSAEGEFAFVWLAAVKDADVRCTAPGCVDGGTRYGDLPALNLALADVMPPGIQKTYVAFYLPQFPPGTEVVEAHLNLFEQSEQIPSAAPRPVDLVPGPWDPMRVSYDRQPVPPGARAEMVGEFAGFGARDTWRGTLARTSALVPAIEAHLADPASNHGFVIQNFPDPSGFYLRSFSSLNHPSRTASDMGQAPRLLLKLRLPEADPVLSAGTVVLPPLPPETDLDETLPAGEVLVMRVAGGTDWPAEWRVAVD